MNIDDAKKNVANTESTIAALDARIASETNRHREAVAKRDNLASLLANGEIKPDQVASVQGEAEGYATILAQYRTQRDQLTRALAVAEMDVIVAEAESEDSPLLTSEDRAAMVAEIIDAMTPALTAYVEKVKAHNAKHAEISRKAVRSEYANVPVRKSPYMDSLDRVTVGNRQFPYIMTAHDSSLTDAIAARLAELR